MDNGKKEALAISNYSGINKVVGTFRYSNLIVARNLYRIQLKDRSVIVTNNTIIACAKKGDISSNIL